MKNTEKEKPPRSIGSAAAFVRYLRSPQLLQLLPDLKVIIDNGSGTQTMLPLEPFANVTEGTSGNQTPQAAAPAGQ